MCMWMWMCIWMCTWMQMSLCMCMWMWMQMWMCICMCMWVYMNQVKWITHHRPLSFDDFAADSATKYFTFVDDLLRSGLVTRDQLRIVIAPTYNMI